MVEETEDPVVHVHRGHGELQAVGQQVVLVHVHAKGHLFASLQKAFLLELG